jgi:hypothetical protein
MFQAACRTTLLLGLVLCAPQRAEASPAVPRHVAEADRLVLVQSHRDRCRWLRHDIHRLESRIAYAAPWERRRLERRLRDRRRESRQHCRRW